MTIALGAYGAAYPVCLGSFGHAIFVQHNAMPGTFFLPEITGSGLRLPNSMWLARAAAHWLAHNTHTWPVP